MVLEDLAEAPQQAGANGNPLRVGLQLGITGEIGPLEHVA
jgi:hypothetical protein